MKLLGRCCFFILLASICRAQDWVALVEHKDLRSSSYQGSQWGAALNRRSLVKDLDLSVGLSRLSRKFPDGSAFDENNYSLGFVKVLSQGFYCDGQADISPGALILPRDSYTLTAHWVLGQGELGLGLNYRQYVAMQSGYLHPSYYVDLAEKWGFTVGAFFSRTSEFITAYHGALAYKFLPGHGLRLDIAAGRTLEDAGLEADFESQSLEYAYSFRFMTLVPSYSRYKSSIRTEDAFGIRLEFRR